MFAIREYLPYFTQIPRKVTGNPSTVLQLCTPNPDRAILYITVELTQLVWLWHDPNGDTTAPDYAFQGPDSARFTWKDDGPIPTLGFWGMIGGASGTVSFRVNEWIWSPPLDAQ